jgi:hypothetical protein
MHCEFVRSPVPRRPLCWYCSRLDIRDITVAKQPQVSYTCGWNPIRAPNVDRCQFFMREPGADDRAQRRRRWRAVNTAQ